MYLKENLYFFYISLKSNLVDLNDFVKWLNNHYADNSNIDILYELECAFNDVDKILSITSAYIYDKIDSVNFDIVWHMIIDAAQKWCDENKDIKLLTQILYKIWCDIPSDISAKTPYIKLNSIDDMWECYRENAPKKIKDFLYET